ncbi:MAG: AlpA family transcriptional regulator [Hyphomonadaceae bacterium]|nr:AlpA family transcriptional regulator [Hyphomonadaceae bacterium]
MDSRPDFLKRAVRRRQLRQMVPLADTTIYEMEQRGEFPRRFYLTPRCVAWDAAEIEAWLEERQRTSSAHLSKRVPSPDVRKRTSRPVRR